MSDTQQSQAALLKLPRQLSTFHWQTIAKQTWLLLAQTMTYRYR